MELDLKLQEIKNRKEELEAEYLFVYPADILSINDFVIQDRKYYYLWNEADKLAVAVNNLT